MNGKTPPPSRRPTALHDRLNSGECSRYLRALADPERLKIIQCLQPGPLTVGRLTEQLGGQVGNVSHHLKRLREAGLVVARKEGRFVHYSLAPHLVRAADNKANNVLEFGCCRIELAGQ